MGKYIFGLALLMSCGNTQDYCPAGAFLDEWQVISDGKSSHEIICNREVVIQLAAHGSVWLSSTKYEHTTGSASLGCRVSGCDDSRQIIMSMGTTTKPAVSFAKDRYTLQANVADPWLVAIGLESATACQATISEVGYQ